MSMLTPAQEWWTAEEIAAAAMPDLPASRQGVEAVIKRLYWRENGPELARRREGKGGGWEYSWQLFPDRARRQLLQAAAATLPAPTAPARLSRDEAWEWFEKMPQSVKAKAEARLKIIATVEAVERVSQQGRHLAVATVARTSGNGARTIWTWFAMIEGVRVDDRLPYLAPRNRAQADRARSKEFDPEFFSVLKSMYLRPTRPTFSDCYRDSVKIAASKGWDVLPERTMRRNLNRAVSIPTQVLTRDGEEAFKRLYPPQVRDKTAMVAMEGVNSDFHRFDVFVHWPALPGEKEGVICRPQMVGFQDIFSAFVLSWRVDRTPNSTAVQLAAGDMIEAYGIPKHVLFDNGREFAAKDITGGALTRNRFKIKEDDIRGLFTNLGCEIHWATPYHGQAKPIERAWRDMCSSIAKDVRFDGAYTGNNPMAKPEDYGSKAVPLEYFLKVVAERIAEHNTRAGRRSPVAFGRSFAEVFDESYATAPIRKATEAQRRMWLLGVEGLRADNAGAVWFQGNEFYAPWMLEIAKQRIVVRFDRADYRAGLHIYSQDEAYLGHAPIRQAKGFFDQDEARLHARAMKDFLKANRNVAKAHQRLKAAELGVMMDEVAPIEIAPPESKVVKPVFGKGKGLLATAHPAPTFSDEDVRAGQAVIAVDLASRRKKPTAVAADRSDDPRELFREALRLERALAAGELITKDSHRWLAAYQQHPAYAAERMLWELQGDAIFG